MSDTAFQEEEQVGPPQQGALGPPEAAPTEEMGPPTGLNDEQVAAEKKNFNRSKMGGFLMELGLNILSSNRDDAGAAVGDAFGKTRSDRDARKQTAAADSLAKSERAREQRREDESDTLKQEKADREVAKDKRDAEKAQRDIEKAESDKLHEFELSDGTVAFYEKREGPVTDRAGNKITLSKKDADRLSASSKEASYRDLRRAISTEKANIKEEMPDELYINGEPTEEEILALAKKYVKGTMKEAKALFSERDVDDLTEKDIQDYDTLDY